MDAFLREQAALHPCMQPRDALKMCYQAAFGAEHLLRDPGAAAAYLRDELSACPADPGQPLTEALSPDTCRVNLAAWKSAGLPEAWLGEMFLRSCAPRQNGGERFLRFLEAVDAAAGSLLPFSREDWQREKRAYLAQGVRPVHHSEAYRAAERPAYRVIEYRYARMLPLLAAVGRARPCVVALDGRCASGKTTLAGDMAAICGASVLHMDDFFLPKELRTPERLRAPGGNVHYERFLTDALPGLKSGKAFAYPRFDCGAMALRGERAVPAASLYIVEGAYSCHPALGEYMTLRAFSDITPEEQQRRILARNGKAGLDQFNARWIPMEERYFSYYAVREKADLILPAQAQPGCR